MATNTHIEWTEMTWNPVRGCSRESEGCRHCYAERMAARFSGPGKPYYDLAVNSAAGPRWTNVVRTVPEMLDVPRRWRKPRVIFVNSMSDLFHPDVPVEFIRDVFNVMRECPQHTFQVLTKRSKRLVSLGDQLTWPDNVWMGVSIEDDTVAYRAHDLARVPAAIRFVSAEPLIGPVINIPYQSIHWMIVGGESGPGARPIDVEWVESILSSCKQHGTAFFFKQWGGVRKGRFGRLLHERTYDEMPTIAHGANVRPH
jgi:protein gp37